MVEVNDMLLLHRWLPVFKRENQNLCYQEPKCEKSMWVFWSDPTSSSCNPNLVPPDAYTSNSIKSALQTLKLFIDKDLGSLIQYWAATTSGGRSKLTTSNQPFAVNQLDEELLDYRMCSLDYDLNVDDKDLGLLGRVFRHKLPELTPNVQYYSIKEYPQRQDALRCHIQFSLALPVFEPSGQCCVGVLHLLSTAVENFFITFELVWRHLEKAGLKGLSPLLDLEIICDAGLQNAITEIRKGVRAVCKNHKLPLARTWVPCRQFSDVAYGSSPEKSSAGFNVICRGEIMSTLPHAYYFSDDYRADGFYFCTMRLHLQKGQGVVGRAYMSHNSCFCGDVTQFSITDYPLARYHGLASCFAICLRSTEYTGDLVYVLEFFFPPGKTDGEGDQRTLLNSLLATMKQHFPSFKIASGKELGEELDVQFLDFPTIVNSIQICQTARSPPSPEPSQNVGDMVQLHSSHPQLMVEDDAIQNEMNVVSAEQIETAVTHSEKEGTIEIPETQHRTTEISFSYEVLKQHFGRKLEDAAESLHHTPGNCCLLLCSVC